MIYAVFCVKILDENMKRVMCMRDDFIAIFRDKRLKLGLTQAAVADALHISPKAWSKIETGRNELKFEYVRPLCELLEIPYSDVVRVFGDLFPDYENDWARVFKTHGKFTEITAAQCDYEARHFGMPDTVTLRLTDNELSMFRLMAEYFGYDERFVSDWGEFVRMFQAMQGHRNAVGYRRKIMRDIDEWHAKLVADEPVPDFWSLVL